MGFILSGIGFLSDIPTTITGVISWLFNSNHEWIGYGAFGLFVLFLLGSD